MAGSRLSSHSPATTSQGTGVLSAQEAAGTGSRRGQALSSGSALCKDPSLAASGWHSPGRIVWLSSTGLGGAPPCCLAPHVLKPQPSEEPVAPSTGVTNKGLFSASV